MNKQFRKITPDPPASPPQSETVSQEAPK